ncbi:GNAT family N-acetyltransferase [Gelatiniphilus marinus]|uniref:GNAT family N-acetyltransferase n=1 Tax=Gelatiniphilus marinus TaxID=1759464 RepID=A0ABW5JMI0_9FLAO
MLKGIKLIKYNVLNSFLEKKKPFPIYSNVVNSFTNTSIYKAKAANIDSDKNIYCISDFPDYLKAELNNKNWKAKRINTFKGSLIFFKNHENTQQYLKTKFNTPKRFRIYQSKLENCFNIEYKSFYGEISKKEYDFLFDAFYKMLKKRFSEKQIKNTDLDRWDTYKEIAYPLINSKDAVLFVIYDNEKPISLYLNLIQNKTIYGYIKTYDIDYSKFSVGFTNFIQQLRWCFENGFEVYDLLKGNYPYKNKLIDTEFYYQKHVIYNSKSLFAVICANIIIAKTQVFYALVNGLKKFNVDVLYHSITSFIHKLNTRETKENLIIVNNIELTTTDKLCKIDITDESFSFLKRAVYTFLYHNKESLKTVEIFKFKNKLNTFFIKGKKKNQKIEIK